MKKELAELLRDIKNRDYLGVLQRYEELSKTGGQFHANLDFNINYILKKQAALYRGNLFYQSANHPIKPLISVIVPVYNKADFIYSSINSIVKQTLQPVEILLIDDGSTDGSILKVIDLAKANDNIKIFWQPNQGAAAARNLGLKHATGDYVAFMDADDFYPDYDTLANIHQYAKLARAKVIGGSLYEFRDGKVIYPPDNSHDPYKFTANRWQKFHNYQYDYGFSRFIYKRDFLQRHKIRFPLLTVQEDPIFCIRALHHARIFYTLKLPTYIYRKNQEERIKTVEQCLNILKGYNIELLFAKKHNYAKLHKLIADRLHSSYIADALRKFATDPNLQKQLAQTLNAIDYALLYRGSVADSIVNFYDAMQAYGETATDISMEQLGN